MTGSDADPRRTADDVLRALARLETTLATLALDEVDADSRALGTCRRTVVQTIAGHLDRTAAELRTRTAATILPATAPSDDRILATGDGVALARALHARRDRLVEALDGAVAAGRDDVGDDLVALLARIELAHVSLDACYDLDDLPPASVAACARISDAYERLRRHRAGTDRVRPTARRRRGIPWPRGRRSS